MCAIEGGQQTADQRLLPLVEAQGDWTKRRADAVGEMSSGECFRARQGFPESDATCSAPGTQPGTSWLTETGRHGARSA
jgi:hypothetical protein